MYIQYYLECTSFIYLIVHILISDFMNINLGVPYETIVKKIIEKEYAGNQTEVIRQALLVYERLIEEEEVLLVNKGIELEMQEIKQGKINAKDISKIKKKYGL